MRAKIESSGIGRVLISLGVICVVFAVLVVNMPDSRIRSLLLDRGVGPFVRATGLDQSWGVFSDVRTVSVYVEGRVENADGSVTVTGIPDSSGIAAYSDYRWQKFEEQVRLDNNSRLWEPYARWLADRDRAHGHNPVRVSLVRRFAKTFPPGPGPEREPLTEFTFFVLPLSTPS